MQAMSSTPAMAESPRAQKQQLEAILEGFFAGIDPAPDSFPPADDQVRALITHWKQLANPRLRKFTARANPAGDRGWDDIEISRSKSGRTAFAAELTEGGREYIIGTVSISGWLKGNKGKLSIYTNEDDAADGTKRDDGGVIDVRRDGNKTKLSYREKHFMGPERNLYVRSQGAPSASLTGRAKRVPARAAKAKR